MNPALVANFTEFRDDGFPLCPGCGCDELYSHLMVFWDCEKEPRPTMAEVLAGSFSCYLCGWCYLVPGREKAPTG